MTTWTLPAAVCYDVVAMSMVRDVRQYAGTCAWLHPEQMAPAWYMRGKNLLPPCDRLVLTLYSFTRTRKHTVAHTHTRTMTHTHVHANAHAHSNTHAHSHSSAVTGDMLCYAMPKWLQRWEKLIYASINNWANEAWSAILYAQASLPAASGTQ